MLFSYCGVSRDGERNTRKITKRQIIFTIIFIYFYFPIFTNGKIVRIVRETHRVFARYRVCIGLIAPICEQVIHIKKS